MVERAVAVNTVPGQNVYVGQALRDPGIPPFGRCKDEDFFALTAFYVDLDDDVIATARISYRHRGCPPTAVVVTGRHPHVRAQMLWRLETPERDPETCRSQNLALANALEGDPSVINPSRVLRLGGSIAWPTKPGRVLERTEFLIFDDGRPKIYFPGQIAKAFPTEQTGAASVAPSHTSSNLNVGSEFDGVSVETCLAEARAGRQWHNNLVRLTAHWIARGWSDEEILMAAEALTLPGYEIEQTRQEVARMLTGGRAKWNIANPDHEITDDGAGGLHLTGLFSSKADAAVPTATYDATRPPIWKNGRALIDRYASAMASMSVDWGNALTNPDNPNALEGFDPAIITRRAMTGSVDPMETLVATRDVMTAFRNGAQQIVHARFGSVAGNRIGLTIPAAFYTNQTPGDRDCVATVTVPFSCVGEDSGAYLCFY